CSASRASAGTPTPSSASCTTKPGSARPKTRASPTRKPSKAAATGRAEKEKKMELTWRKRLWKMGDTLFHKMTFEEAAAFNVLRLYAGDIPPKPLYENQGFIGLSIKQADWNT